MGSRGKRRKRADGSVADGRDKPLSLSAREDWDYDPVTAQALSMAVTIRNRLFPLDEEAYAAMVDRVGELDDQYYLLSDDLNALADATGQDHDALGLRAEQLWLFLREPRGARFHTVTAEGEVQVDLELLNYAASKPASSMISDKISWPLG